MLRCARTAAADGEVEAAGGRKAVERFAVVAGFR
jgi:hypothetical protein